MMIPRRILQAIQKSAAALMALLIAASPVCAAAAKAVPAPSGSAAMPASVRSIGVTDGQVKIELSSAANYEDFILSNPPRIVLQISGASYGLAQKMFPGVGTAIKDVRASQFATQPVDIARVVLDLTRATAYQVMVHGNILLVSLAAKAAPAPSKMSSASPPNDSQTPIDIMNRLPTGKITVDFDQTAIRDVLKLFAAKAKINIIYGPDVSGQLTLHLNNVPFDEAFRTVLDMTNLTTTQVGDSILRVLTPDTMAKVQTEAATATKIIPLNYSKAGDLVATIQQIVTAEKIPGMAIADAKTNSVIITASPDSLAQIDRLVGQLDVRPKQVLIEAKLVEVALDNSLDYGIQWNEVSQGSNHGGTDYTGLPLSVGGLAAAGGTAGTTGTTGTGINFSNFANNPPAATIPSLANAATGSGVSLAPVVPAFGALTLGRITSHYILNATLSAAAAVGKVKILSDPKIATLNNQPANINVTTQIPYVTTTVVPGNVGSGATVPETVNYVTEGIQLTVTPIINADGRITLTINPNISQPSATATGNAATGAPAVDTRSAQTTVMVKDGDTIVIGGLIHDSMTDQVGKVPILGDLPLIGWLFRNVNKVHTRNELLIFVTPKIITD
ncbi:MAG: type IV pilus secretin PilQ [Elusimicrobiota bacterium]